MAAHRRSARGHGCGPCAAAAAECDVGNVDCGNSVGRGAIMLLHRHPQAEMQGAPRFGQLQHHPRATPLPEQLFAQRPAAAADRLHGEDEARLRQPVAVAAAAPAELVVGGVLEGRGGSDELVCARTRLLALSLELELAQLDAGGGGRRISACFRSFATRWTAATVYERAREGRGSSGGVFGCSTCTLPV